MNRETRKFVRRMKLQRLASAMAATSTATTSPARTPGVDNASPISAIAPTRNKVRQASPNSNLRLKSMLLHAPVERTAAQPQLGRGQRHVEMVHAKRALDHLPLELVQVEAVADDRKRCGLRPLRQGEVLDAVAVPVGHDDGALGGVT